MAMSASPGDWEAVIALGVRPLQNSGPRSKDSGGFPGLRRGRFDSVSGLLSLMVRPHIGLWEVDWEVLLADEELCSGFGRREYLHHCQTRGRSLCCQWIEEVDHEWYLGRLLYGCGQDRRTWEIWDQSAGDSSSGSRGDSQEDAQLGCQC